MFSLLYTLLFGMYAYPTALHYFTIAKWWVIIFVLTPNGLYNAF